jgi:FMN reductase (NADPH)
MIQAIKNHRSVRKYKSDPIQEDLLNNLLEAGIRASNTGNMQIYSIVVTRDVELKKKLWEAHFKQGMILQAPVIMTFCADINRFGKWCKSRQADPGYDNFVWFVNAATDVILASQNVALEAEANGLGVCYLGTTTYMASKIVEILGLPKGVIPVTAFVVGYPDEDKPLTDRLPLEAIVHQETYHDYSNGDIDRLYAEREASQETLELLKINNKETLAQIFTDNRYKKADNVFFSNEYMDCLKKQGFMNNRLA